MHTEAVLIDCATLWLTNLMLADADLAWKSAIALIIILISLIGGRIPGRRDASIVLPAPGGPMISSLI